MKKIYTTALFIILSLPFCRAQTYVNIPDANFAGWLNSNGFSTCMKGDSLNIDNPIVLSTTQVKCGGRSISDLTGLENFTSLTYLDCSTNNLIALPNLSNTVRVINCSFNQITDISNLPDAITQLNADNNAIDSISFFPPSLDSLSLQTNLLISIPSLPPNLSYLDVGFGYTLTSLPNLPSSLNFLNCSDNQISVLPVLPSNLKVLWCMDNLLTVLPALPNGLTDLIANDNQLVNLPTTLPDSLTDFRVNDMTFASLPPLPTRLQYLYCENCKLPVLPAMPDALGDMEVDGNQLTSLPTLPINLGYLVCSSNQLTSLPALPDKLYDIHCDYNQISTLPELPSSLTTLYCGVNKLTSLPFLPAKLSTLICFYNELTSLPALPATMEYLIVNNNSSLTCLPPIQNVTGTLGIDIDFTAITCLPNIIQHPNSIPAIDTLPLCGLFNPSGCEIAWNIQGNVAKDADGSCSTTNDGTQLQNISVKLYSNSNSLLQQMYVNVAGNYSFDTQLGTFNVKTDTAGLPFTLICPSGNVQTAVLTSTDSLDYSANFRFYCKPGYDLGVNAITSNKQFFPNDVITVPIFAGDEANYYGVGCNTSGLTGTVTAIISGPVTVASASTGTYISSKVSGDTVIWSISDFSKIVFGYSFFVNLRTNTQALEGQEVCIKASINSGNIDNDPTNDTLMQCFTVTNSHDPNNKEVNPPGLIAAGYNGYLTYTVHFQNTGTAPARNIQVIDTISKSLDISTFQLLAYSNQNITQVFDASRIVKFSFPNINLPDSTSNEPDSHGYIQYKIKPLSNLPKGSSIKNTASIYFDFNSPIVTNTVSNILCNPDTTYITGGLCEGKGSYFLNGRNYTMPGSYDTTFTSATGCDSVVILNLVILDPILPTNLYDTLCAGNTINFNDTIRNVSGNYSVTYSAVNGCDSVVVLSLFIRDPVLPTNLHDTLCAGNTINFNDTLRNASGNYPATYHSINRCDSLVTLSLFVRDPIAPTNLHDTLCAGNTLIFNDTARNATGNYSVTYSAANGCDSVVNLNLTIRPAIKDSLNASICPGGVYMFNNSALSIPGIYYATLPAANGCDSAITINLSLQLINAYIHQFNDTLIAGGNGTIQWLNCDNGQIINGTNDSTFIALAEGNYAAIITNGQCTDTTSCVQIIITGTRSVGEESDLLVYPNPSSGQLTVSSGQLVGCEVSITDILGRTILTQIANNNKTTLNVSSVASGVYFVHINSGGVNEVRKFVKE